MTMKSVILNEAQWSEESFRAIIQVEKTVLCRDSSYVGMTPRNKKAPPKKGGAL
jgi:hypothetical protein